MNRETSQHLQIVAEILRQIKTDKNSDELQLKIDSFAAKDADVSQIAQNCINALKQSLPQENGLQAIKQTPEEHKTANEVGTKKHDRGYLDGCFDLMHTGHFNALRQASLKVPFLVAGACSEAEIAKAKGPSVLTSEERIQIVKAVKWVNEAHIDTPYDVDESVLDKYNCQYFLHGDDPVFTADGEDMCQLLREKDRFKMVKRTTGISTTDITGKLLSVLDAQEAQRKKQSTGSSQSSSCEDSSLSYHNPTIKVPYSLGKEHFVQTSTRIANFSNRREPGPNDTVVYISCSCDLMHPGLIERLKAAKSQGDFLYVGIWDDDTASYFKGESYPLQGLQERILMALAIKYVDDVVIGAPYILTADLLSSLGVNKVVNVLTKEDTPRPGLQSIDPYKVAKELDIYHEFPAVENDLTIEEIALRVKERKEDFQRKFNKKAQKQAEYYKTKKQNSYQSTQGDDEVSNKSGTKDYDPILN